MRQLVDRHIGTNAGIAKFRSVQECEALHFLSRLSENPDNFFNDIRL